ncbi:hypothetical protein SAMN05518866_13740 [Sphingobium sp. YR768]|nr:hypothetical protein SAMN05518866_13740 [Sphingobium sp. YR768]
MASAVVTPHPQWGAYLLWRDAFADVLDPECYAIDWLDQQVAAGTFVLFSDEKSAILVAVKRYPTGLLELHGQIAVGELNALIASTIPSAENWARSIGCARAVIESRRGWSRVMAQFGYSEHQVHIRKELS